MFSFTRSSFIKIAVPIKRIIDVTTKVRVKGGKVDTAGVKMVSNYYDEIALEESVRLLQKKVATSVVAITIGPKKNEETLRAAIALGATDAVHIVTSEEEAAGLESLAVAKILAKLHAELKPDLWFMGKMAIDEDFGCTPQILAGLLDLPQGTFASKVTVEGGNVHINREIDAGEQEIDVPLPAVVTADLRLNTPRFASLPNIMKARQKKIDTREVKTLGVDIKPRLQKVSVVEPAARKPGGFVKDVDELVDKLRNEAKVI